MSSEYDTVQESALDEFPLNEAGGPKCRQILGDWFGRLERSQVWEAVSDLKGSKMRCGKTIGASKTAREVIPIRYGHGQQQRRYNALQALGQAIGVQ
jgi:hypothetical protein